MTNVPLMMQALELQAYGGRPEDLVLTTKPVPKPGPGEVLVQVAASPINPSDLLFVRGGYGKRKPLPVVPGLEASGVVVAAGRGLYPRFLLGQRVACVAGGRDGAWAEYLATKATHCVPLPRRVSLEEGAMTLVNPLTAWALLEVARQEGHRAVVQTAAASALGKMVVQLGRSRGLPVINVVRRAVPLETFPGGADPALVLDSSQPEFEAKLREACHRWQATLALDAVAGPMTGILLQAMPRGGKALVYGALSGEDSQVDTRQLIFEGKQVAGFWLAQPAPLSQLDLYRGVWAVRSRLDQEFKSKVRLRLPLSAAAQGLAAYAGQMGEGKVLFTPNPGLARARRKSSAFPVPAGDRR